MYMKDPSLINSAVRDFISRLQLMCYNMRIAFLGQISPETKVATHVLEKELS